MLHHICFDNGEWTVCHLVPSRCKSSKIHGIATCIGDSSHITLYSDGTFKSGNHTGTYQLGSDIPPYDPVSPLTEWSHLGYIVATPRQGKAPGLEKAFGQSKPNATLIYGEFEGANWVAGKQNEHLEVGKKAVFGVFVQIPILPPVTEEVGGTIWPPRGE